MSWQNIKDLFKSSSFSKPNLLEPLKASQAIILAHNYLLANFGEAILEATQARYVKNNVLYLAVLEAPLLSELKLRERELLQAVNQELGEEFVKRIAFLV